MQHTPTAGASRQRSDVARRHVWLGALRGLAELDGHLTPDEQQLLEEHLSRELPGQSLDALGHPGDAALCHRLGVGTPAAEEFLRSALAVALADGYLSPRELERLRHWSALLQVGTEQLQGLKSDCGDDAAPNVHLLDPLRRWLDGINPQDPAVARFLVKLIPAQCPFERDVVIFGRKLAHIPPMCKVNPLYEQLMTLRFRCLCSLAGEMPGNELSS